MDTELTEYDEIGQVALNTTGFIPFIQIDQGVDLDDLQRYFSIEFETWTWDPEGGETDGDKIKKKIHNSKPCEASDFPNLDDEFVGSILQTTRDNV